MYLLHYFPIISIPMVSEGSGPVQYRLDLHGYSYK
jgi:hypothetical protein